MIDIASWLSRGLFSLATLLAAGSCFIVYFTAVANKTFGKKARRVCSISAFAGLVFAMLWAIAIAAELGGEWQASLDLFYYELIWASPAADLLLLRSFALLMLLLWATIPRFSKWIGLISAIAAIVSFTLYGHALGNPQWLKSFLLATHLSVIAWWIAVVPVLLALLSVSTSDALLLADRFAEQAKWAIAVAVLSGLTFLGFQLAADQWHLDTLYFKTVLIKLIVVVVIMFIGAMNRYRLFPALKMGAENANKKVYSILLFDGALFVAVVFLSTWLTGPASNN